MELNFALLSTCGGSLSLADTTPPFPGMDGIVYTQNNFEGCSASLMAFAGYQKTDAALVLTNGHCTGKGSFMGQYPSDKDFFINVPPRDNRGGTQEIEFLTQTQKIVRGQAAKLILGTMTGTDIGLYEMTETYGDLEQKGLAPLILESNVDLTAGDTVTLVTSYWRRSYTCTFEANVSQIKEGPWTWNKALRFSPDNCPLQDGASGSPLIGKSGKIVGIINTVNMDGETCTLNNPCEVSAEGPIVRKKSNYGLVISDLYKCLDDNRHLDFSLASCPLGK